MAEQASPEELLQNPETRIRINAETYIKFDGSDQVVLQYAYTEGAVRIKYDILLILYDLIDWKALGDLLAPWPPSDQEKIIDSLLKMHQAKIISFEHEPLEARSSESVATDSPTDTAAPSLNTIHINAENHFVMLKDYVRMAAYRRAIERQVTPDTVALDLGTGSGILSFFTARAGARHVYAIEKRPDILLLAKELARINQFETIEFIEGASTTISETVIQPKASLFVSEILGNGILEENVLEYTLDARNRFLRPDAKLIPCQLDILVFPFDSGFHSQQALEVAELKDLYGIDFTLLGQLLQQKVILRLERFNPMLYKILCPPVMAKSIDLERYTEAKFNDQFTFQIETSGSFTGFCAYFRAHLDEETVMTNSPWAPLTHWVQMVYTLPVPKSVQAGDVIPMSIDYDGMLRIALEESTL